MTYTRMYVESQYQWSCDLRPAALRIPDVPDPQSTVAAADKRDLRDELASYGISIKALKPPNSESTWMLLL